MLVSKKKYIALLNDLEICKKVSSNLSEELEELKLRLSEIEEKENDLKSLIQKEKDLEYKISQDTLLLDELVIKFNKKNTELRDLDNNIVVAKKEVQQLKSIEMISLLKQREFEKRLNDLNDEITIESQLYYDRIKAEEKRLSNRLEKEINKKRTSLLTIERKIRTATELLKEKEPMIQELSVLKSKVVFLRNEYQLQEVGFYKSLFPFSTTEQYKEEMEVNKEKQKELIKNKQAINEGTTWTINGSLREGRKMVNLNKKFMTRSFNMECDNAISALKHSNLPTIKKRIIKSFDSINNFNRVHNLSITDEFLQLKLNEMELVFELKRFRQEEKEKLSALKAEVEEQRKIEREIREKHKELDAREKELKKHLKLLNDEYQKDQGQKNIFIQIKEVENNISLVNKKREEVNRRLEIGKSGYVYVISNIGTLGKDIYKIGMTRRLEPADRIRELSGAAVPFNYDVHAMILTDNAPRLENHLHNTFNDKRVNMVNNRKEFFDVSLEEIKEEVFKVTGKNVVFEDTPEASQFYETIALRSAMQQINNEDFVVYH